MRSEYKIAAIRELERQIEITPRAQRFAQIDRAERLLAEVECDREYPIEFIYFRITEYRPGDQIVESASGEDVRHDLSLMIEDLSASLDLSADAVGEHVLTIDEVSKRFQVSTKTVSRWRRQGLAARRFRFGGRRRVGFLKSSVDRFVARNPERVQRGAQFSQLSEEEREEVIRCARRLATSGACPSDVVRRVAERLGRSVETVRYTVKAFDAKFPELAVFPDASEPLSDAAKAKIFEQFKLGRSVASLAKRFQRTRTSIYRIVNEQRARSLLDLPLDYMHNEEFERDDADEVVLGPPPTGESQARKTRLPPGLPAYLASLYETPLLNREQEGHLFRQYNYLKFKAARLREGLEPTTARRKLMDEIEDLYKQALDVKNRIVRANLRLVVSIAKRHVGSSDNFFELVSDGNMSLIRAVEKFDYARGNKFSTYASWAIMKNFARTIPNETKHRDRFRTSQEEVFAGTAEFRSDERRLEGEQAAREWQVGRMMRRLDEREHRIIASRFGLRRGEEPRTLQQVGEELGVTKERVRQIEARALSKLRDAAEDDSIDAP